MKRRYFTIAIALITIIVASAGIMSVSRHNRNYTPKSGPNTSQSTNQNTNQSTNIKATNNYTFPGEFENQQAIWIQWPTEAYNRTGNPVTPVTVNIIKALAPYIRVNVAARSNSDIEQIKGLLAQTGYNGTNVNYYNVDHLSIWTRDVGPIFVKDKRNNLNIVDFGFNNYSRDGDSTYIYTENQVHRLIAGLYTFPLIATNLISEGGAIESNGKGTLMTVEAVALKRNPGLTKDQIENEYKRVLGLTKVIWLKKGLAEDDSITSGHINEFARFADANTILLAQILPEDRYANSFSQESYQRMEENYNVLKNSTDQDGNPFRIIRIPMPPTLYNETDNTGSLPVRSYLNYAVTNGAVLMQNYWRPGRSDILRTTEANIKDVFKNIFPEREIIGIDAENINLWGGGIHCVTQHMPAQ